MPRYPALESLDRLLVLALGGAGDSLMLAPLLEELRAIQPAARLDVLVMQGRSAAELMGAIPAVTEVLHHDFRSAGRWASLRFCQTLRRRRYDCVISPMPHHRLEHNLIAWLIGGGVRVGFRYAINSGALPRWFLHRTIAEDTRRHIVENNLRILPELLGRPLVFAGHRLRITVPEAARVRAVQALAALPEGAVRIGLHPGSGTTKNLELKRWPVQLWAALIDQLRQDRPAASLVLLCGPGEEALCDTILGFVRSDPVGILRLPVMPILDMAAVLEGLDAVVCCDNLITHLAAAVDTPTVAIYGPTSHVHASPYGVRHRVVRTGIACSPCYGYSRHGIRCTNAVFLRCLRELEPALVATALRDLLANG